MTGHQQRITKQYDVSGALIVLRVSQSRIGAGIELSLAFTFIRHNFQGVAGVATFGFRAQRLGFTRGRHRFLGFRVVAAHFHLSRHSFNQIAQADSGHVFRAQYHHGFTLFQRGIICEYQLIPDNLKGVAILFGQTAQKLNIALLILGHTLDFDVFHLAVGLQFQTACHLAHNLGQRGIFISAAF